MSNPELSGETFIWKNFVDERKVPNMSHEDEDQSLRHDVDYLRFLLESGLSEDEIKEIAKEKNPKLELCFSEEACMTLSKTLERGKYLVLIS
jgi:hypothetical protein